MEDSDQIARRSRGWSAMRDVVRLFRDSHGYHNPVSFHPYRVRMGLIEVENDSRDKRIGAVLAGAHAAHPVRIHRDASKVVVAGGIGKIEQNAVWIGRRFKRRRNGGTEREFHAQIGSLKRRRHALHRRCPGAVLGGRAGQQEHQDPEMFLNCLHSLLTLAGVPSAAWSLAFPSVFASALHQPKQALIHRGGTDNN
jgi:hypothetical protein